MPHLCHAYTKDAPHAYNARKSHPCRNPVWHDGYCKVHHPQRRLERLTRQQVALEKSLARVLAEIAEVKSTGVAVNDVPGQLRMFADDSRAMNREIVGQIPGLEHEATGSADESPAPHQPALFATA